MSEKTTLEKLREAEALVATLRQQAAEEAKTYRAEADALDLALGIAVQVRPRKRADGTPVKKTCAYCHQPGHWQNRCPKKKVDNSPLRGVK